MKNQSKVRDHLQENPAGQKHVWKIAWILFFFALVPRVIQPMATTICYDEMAAKDSGQMWELLKKGDFQSEGWAQYPYLPFYKYIYGMLPQMLSNANPSDPDDLVGARWMGALVGSGTVAMTFLIGIYLMPIPAAAIAALLLAWIPTVLGHDRIAMHDAPSRLLALASWWMILRWNQKRVPRDFIFSACLAGLSITFFHRTGITSGLAMAIWLAFVLKKEAIPLKKSIRKLAFYGVISLGVFFITVWLFWPYMWFRPWELLRWYKDPVATAGSTEGSLEYWFGSIQPVPRYYYGVALLACTPPFTLIAFLMWHAKNLLQIGRDHRHLLIALLFWIPLLVASFTLRQGLTHYLQILFPAFSLGAGMVVWNFRDQMILWFPQFKRTMGLILMMIFVGPEINACAGVKPYYFEYFNVFVGGCSHVTEKKMFTQGIYGEAIGPLFDELHKDGKSPGTVLCRLGPWPSLRKQQQYLGQEFPLQGYQIIDPLGARYILRTGFERDNAFYRYLPDTRFYRKLMDVKADGGSLGDVWERISDIDSTGLLYQDDFASPQALRLIEGSVNVNLNPFSDGKLCAAKAGEPAKILMKIPSAIFKNQSKLRCEMDLRMNQGRVQVQAGVDPKNLQVVCEAVNVDGGIESVSFTHPANKDLYVAFEWTTTCVGDGKASSFWNSDWIDAFRIFGVQK